MSNRAACSSRRAICAAARKLFLRNGYDKTTLKEIAADAGLSCRTIYSQFPSKRELFCTVYEDEKHAVRRALLRLFNAAVCSDIESVKNTFFRLFQFVQKREFLSTLYSFGDFPVAYCIDKTSREDTDPLTGHTSLLEGFIVSCQKAGTVRSGNPVEITQAVRALLHLILLDRVRRDSSAGSIIRIFIDGLTV